ncbi:hypothetical protein ACFO25_16655 [Paenactinomyces guangxiensis]|uniref:Uncharacterized protein n=1 Tax=Paenactinomyces guangxiensis TaxID=1490290 RepID=A0A7W1WU20_9BACL|nr:hypothetical protein [Paenactinomyces guangxiensis]MBA4496056.1 hypothetical protein [Paenactinomyces guangxiensis]MBH8593144.1 hypothetical protein [Paenactinomyces guangxiensis]
MDLRYWRLGLETLFVISVIIILKMWVFPFFISIWFPTDDLSALMQEWTVLIVGMITCFVYLGLGSSAKHVYQFSAIRAAALFFIIHLQWLLPVFFLFNDIITVWLRLIGDFVSLFSPGQSFSYPYFVIVYLGLFLLGRGIRVKDEKNVAKKSDMRRFISQKQKR